MKLYDRFSDKGFHTCITTTFGIDFDIYENAVLSRLKGSGCHNNIIIADERMLSLALEDGYALPKVAGKEYTIVGRSPTHGVFHPKIILQLGRQEGQLIVGSANMTAPGLAGNLEIVGHIQYKAEDNGESRLISSAWQYVSRFLRDDRRTQEQHRWILERTPWLSQDIKDDDIDLFPDGTAAAFLCPGEKDSFFSRFVRSISKEKIKRLTIMSPYWDSDLNTVHAFVEALSPDELVILIEAEKGLFPREKISSKMKLIDLKGFMKNRFAHAKLLVAETDTADHVLYGSANCTFAALGNLGNTGRNEEACFYRRLPVNTVLSALGIASYVADGPALQMSEIVPFVHQKEIDLAGAGKRFPGKFELQGDNLLWQPPKSVDARNVKIILLNEKGEEIATQIIGIGNENGIVSYRVSDIQTKISFARVIFPDGTTSAPAIILSLEHLRHTIMREGRTKQTVKVLERLAGEEEDVLLNLPELINLIEIDEKNQKRALEVLIKRGSREKETNKNEPKKEYKALSYADFIASRLTHRASEIAERHHSFHGSVFSDFRGFLNKLINLNPGEFANSAMEDEDIKRALDLPEDDPENPDSNQPSTPPSPLSPSPPPPAPPQSSTRAKKPLANKEYFSDAAQTFSKKVEEKAKSNFLSEIDLFSLRVMLTIAAFLCWRKEDDKIKKIEKNDSWPRVTGKLLFSFFGGKSPLIAKLQAPSDDSVIPADYIECWATCIWVVHSCIIRAEIEKEADLIIFNLKKIMENIYMLIGLRKDELLSSAVTDLFNGMDRSFCQRLKIENGSVGKRHREAVNQLINPTIGQQV